MVLSKKKAKKNKTIAVKEENLVDDSIDLDNVVSQLVKEGKIFNMTKKEVEEIINKGLKREIEKLKISSFVKVLNSKDDQIKYLVRQVKKVQKQISVFKGIDFVVQLAEESKINFNKAKSLIAKLDLVEEENIVKLLYKIKDKIDTHDINISSYDKKLEDLTKLISAMEQDMKSKHSLKEINSKIDKITKTDDEMEKYVKQMSSLTSRFNSKITDSVKKSVNELGKQLSDRINDIDSKSLNTKAVKAKYEGFKQELSKSLESKLQKDLKEVKNEILLKVDTDLKLIDKKLILKDGIVVSDMSKKIQSISDELIKVFDRKLKLSIKNSEKTILTELDSKFTILQEKGFKKLGKATEMKVVKPEVDKKYIANELDILNKNISKTFETKLYTTLNKSEKEFASVLSSMDLKLSELESQYVKEFKALNKSIRSSKPKETVVKSEVNKRYISEELSKLREVLFSEFNSKIENSLVKSEKNISFKINSIISKLENSEKENTLNLTKINNKLNSNIKKSQKNLVSQIVALQSKINKIEKDNTTKISLFNNLASKDKVSKQIDSFRKEIGDSVDDKISGSLKSFSDEILSEVNSKVSNLENKFNSIDTNTNSTDEESVSMEEVQGEIKNEISTLKSDLMSVFNDKLESKFKELQKSIIEISNHQHKDIEKRLNELSDINNVIDKKLNESNGIIDKKLKVFAVDFSKNNKVIKNNISKKDILSIISKGESRISKSIDSRLNNVDKTLKSKLKLVDNKLNVIDRSVNTELKSINQKLDSDMKSFKSNVFDTTSKIKTNFDNELNKFGRKLDSGLEFATSKIRTEINAVNIKVDKSTKNINLKIDSKFNEIEKKVSDKFREVDNTVKKKILEIDKDMKVINKLMKEVDDYKHDLNYKIKKVEIMHDTVDNLMLESSIGKKRKK